MEFNNKIGFLRKKRYKKSLKIKLNFQNKFVTLQS